MNSMKTKTISALVFLVSGLVASGADELTTKAREVFKKHHPSVVTVQLVVKSRFGFAGAGGDARESKQEVTGTVIDGSGLTVLSLSSTDPTALLQGMMGAFGGDGEESMKLKMDSELSDIKLLCNDGSELPAEIVLRDKDLDLAFVRPKTKPSSPLPSLDLANSAKVDVLDEVVAINRLGKVASRVHSASIERINAIVQRPKLFYVPDGDKTSTGLGCPAFTFDGKVVGIFVLRAVKSGGGGGLFGAQGGITGILLPAEDVKKVASQAPAVKEEQK